MSQSFDLILPRQIIFGRGAVRRVAEEVRRLGVSRALVVTSQGMLRRDGLLRLSAALREGSAEATIFAGVEPEHPMDNACDCVNLARDRECNLVVGLGGGSVLDVAKKAAADLEAYKIMIPSTAGSGGEVTHQAVLQEDGRSRSFADRSLTADVAVIDPDISSTMPPRLTALSGIDALAHAIECGECRTGTPVTRALAGRARRLLDENLAMAVDGRPEARENMALGSLMAGMALGNSGTGLGHALAAPLADLGMPHAEAVVAMLPYSMEFNDFAEEDIARVRGLAASLDILPRLVGSVSELAAAAMKDAASLRSNPREVTLSDVVRIYAQAKSDLG